MKKAEVTPNHHAIAVELLNREYGPSNHPADPGRNFTVCFRTTSHAHQVRELSQAIADAEARGEARNAAELLKHQDLVEALQWLPVGTVVNFCDLDDFLEELRGKPLTPGAPGRWLPIRECKHRHKGDLARCVDCRNEDE